MREIVLDTETTNLYVHEGHRLIEVAAVELVDGKPTGRFFHSYINPEMEIPKQVKNDAGQLMDHPVKMTNAQLADKPVFAEIAHELRDFIGDSPVIITCRTTSEGYTLDIAFMDAELERAGLPKIKAEQWINVRRWSEAMFGHSQSSLDKVLDHYKVSRTERADHGHGALLDADLLAAAYPLLSKDYMRFLEDQKKPSPASKTIPQSP